MFNDLGEALYKFVKKSVTDYSTLETTYGNRTFVFTDGTMATVILYDGIKRVVGSREQRDISSIMASTLSPFFKKMAHEIQFVMTRDHLNVERMKDKMKAMYVSADNIGVGDFMKDIFDEQAETMASVCSEEVTLIVLYTFPNVMATDDYKQWVSGLQSKRKQGLIEVPPGTQDETYAIDPMLSLHDTYVDTVSSELARESTGALIEVLNCDRATTYLARALDPLGKSEKWQAWLLPDSPADVQQRFGVMSKNGKLMVDAPPSVRKRMPKTKHITNPALFYPPPLREQLITEEANYTPGNYLQYGGRLYATIVMIEPPYKNVTGLRLVNDLSDMLVRFNMGNRRVPHRLSVRIRAQGLTQGRMRSMFAPIMVGGSSKNSKFLRAYKALSNQAVREEEPLGTISMSLTTWVDASIPNAEELLKSQVVTLRAAVSQWGEITVAEASIDRVEAWMSACPGMNTEHCSPRVATGTLDELMPLLPWGRPASPLGFGGTEFFRSRDGKLLPLAAHSPEQYYWLETMTAPMGGGKSLQANRRHLEYIFAPGRKHMPYLHVLDIGQSVTGLVHLIRDALPEDRKNEVFVHSLRNTREDAVNMLDPKPGLREPLENDLQAIVEWLTALVTPPERDIPYENMSEFCRVVLKATYRHYDDRNERGQPKRFDASITDDPMATLVYEALEQCVDIEALPDKTSWYEVADILARHRKFQEATVAHLFAVPLLSDLARIANEPNVTAEFMDLMTDRGTPIPKAFSPQLSIAMGSYPIFNAKTVLDLRNKKVTAIDLQDVALKNSATARKQGALMYQVAYELFQRNIRLTDDDIRDIPEAWVPYYQERLEELKNTDKHITIDEYHRTMISRSATIEQHDQTGIRATLVREGGRESRKWNLSVTTISQVTTDHGKLFSLGSMNHIIRKGDEDDAKYQIEHMALSETDQDVLDRFVTGPKKGVGVSFLTRFNTVNGNYNQLLTSTVGPKTLWSLTTTFEDKVVRGIVYEHLGTTNGRNALATRFPGGSARDEVTRRKQHIRGDDDDNVTAGAARQVAEELIKSYRDNLLH